MSSRHKQQSCCRVCGGGLQGNQRRWLYGGQKQRGGTPHATPDASSRGSRSGSALSSPWGSTLSLGSCSSSQTLLSPAKAADLLSILTHIVGQPVLRGSGQREFLCGKCASLLERVFKFDTVINRVKLLSSERLQKLKQERDKIRQWLRSAYQQTQPYDGQTKEGLRGDEDEKEGYRSMLRDNLALSEYECWSDKSNSCPYFQRTGKQCKKGKSCQGCDSLRVSDSDYESVCGIPRNLPLQPFSPLALSRDKSQSMPLHWSRVPSVSVSPASGSCLSLQYQSHASSLQSLDSLNGCDPFDWPESASNVDVILRELKGIPWKPVSSPAGSRIPVLGRGSEGRKEALGHMSSTELVRELDFGQQHEEEDMEGSHSESRVPLLELQDEFLPLHKVRSGQMGDIFKQLQEQLEEAQAHIRVLDAQLLNRPQASVKGTAVSNTPTATPQTDSSGGNTSMQKLRHILHTSVTLIQECVGLRDLQGEMRPGTENAASLTPKMSEAVRNIEEVIGGLSELVERQQDMDREIALLRREKQEREADLAMLTAILQSNKDIINDIHVEMIQEDLQSECHMESAMRRLKEQIVWATLQHREALGLCERDAQVR
ncbi:hypothetical protein ACEWY4_019381 [Coilia grayii]|uniref:C3H1-type domain-containing protein n=1 Tax=Coilia grayii TaxID=363190 RepID=A0ABD1J9K1_9TELE